MLIPSKFNGYVKNVRLYNAGGGVGEAMLISAAIGGGTSAITGGDPLKGALLGAATGGIGAGLSPAASAIAPGADLAAAGVTNAATQTATQAAITPAATQAAITPAATQAVSAPTSFGSFGSFGEPAMVGSPAATMADPTNLAQAQLGLNAAPTTSSFQQAMDDPFKYIGQHRATSAGAALTGAIGGQQKNMVPGQEEYNGPLKRFRFNPDTYQAARYAEGGIANLASGGYDKQVGEDPYPVGMASGGISNLAAGGEEPMYQAMASGGISNLGSYSDGGRMLKGPGDGMSDSIPANISGKRPARLADGEFVVPADVVSHLGNGSTDAGAKTLYSMMDKVRTARTGRKAQGKQINPRKYMVA